MEKTTEVYWVIRYRSVDSAGIWQRLNFSVGDRTYSEEEANEAYDRLKAYDVYEVTRSKYTVTREVD